jgi:hypothetical protein
VKSVPDTKGGACMTCTGQLMLAHRGQAGPVARPGLAGYIPRSVTRRVRGRHREPIAASKLEGASEKDGEQWEGDSKFDQ